ncbi:uncharacterized protein TNCV_2382901 [Trichonephila clavipes]|nr:uncharacterized protein TNCV_2382901 [Trichonephila clavipes]
MASAVLADPTRALQGTNRESGPVLEESENDVGSLDQLFLYADEHYLAGKLPLGDHLGKAMASQTITPAMPAVGRRTILHAEIVEVEIEVMSPSIVPSGNFADLNRTVTCMVLKAKDRRTSCPCHDEFRGPRSDCVRQAHFTATRETCEHSMAEAVREAVDENDGKRDLAVAVDGSWQKRGFSSKNGLVTVTSVDTGKVIDVEVFSKHCICPNKTKHLQNCKRNFEGYSGKMEVAGTLSIFQQSQSLYNVRYTKYLGDGDSKAFTSIVENKNGTRLRRLKTKMREVKKLSDGKPLCGRNRLTEAEIDRLQAYYGLAIRRNLSSVKDMQQAIWAIFLHNLSTDEKPQHGFCPSDTDTWCKFKKTELLGEIYHHKNSLPVDAVEAMRPVFRDLANPELLKKYLHGGTQNPKRKCK